MPFTELSAQHVRNLKSYHIKPSAQTNLFIGKNGAGKTNLLEAIYLNGLGRSFRTSSLNQVIAKEFKTAWVFGRFYSEIDNKEYQLGVERSSGNKQRIKINKENQNSIAPLALISPIIAIQPTELNLIDGGSSQRRKYLDWLVFHVKQNYLDLWRNQQKLLKQRNHLLRALKKQPGNTSIKAELKAWDKAFVEVNHSVNQLRTGVFTSFLERLQNLLARFPVFLEEKIEIDTLFYSGWPEEQELAGLLEERLVTDSLKGFTSLGAHRADILFKVNRSSAKDYLSRGQKKLFSIVMRLAQAQELFAVTGKKPVLLIDDLFAELDRENVAILIKLIEELDTQAFFSCLDSEANVRELFSSPPKMFHVKQGSLEPEDV